MVLRAGDRNVADALVLVSSLLQYPAPGTIEGDYVTIQIPYTRASTPHDEVF
jgi:hypothetical protein